MAAMHAAMSGMRSMGGSLSDLGGLHSQVRAMGGRKDIYT